MTLYEILGVMPGASEPEIEWAYQARMRLLRPAVLSGASTKVLVAADRARAAAENAWRVLGDRQTRARYDEEAGLRTYGGGLDTPAAVPSEPRLDVYPVGPGALPGVAAAALDAVAGWLAPHPWPPRRVVVPDVVGLFAGPCQQAAGDADLRMKVVVLTEDPVPVEGLIVDQSPPPGTKVRRFSVLTVKVWHPEARRRTQPPPLTR
jgi:hypothetical protein